MHEEEPDEPAEAAGERSAPTRVEAGSDTQPPRAETDSADEDADQGESTPAAAGKSGRSRRRRKKKPAAAPQSGPEPLQPAYSESEGPRPLHAVKPGGPTGEAAELAEPSVEPEIEPVQAAAPVKEPAAPKKSSKGAVVLAVGLPGSGKTTWFKRRGVTPLSSDLLRSLLFDSPIEQRHQDLVFSSLRSLLRARLIARMPMNYVDATNLSPKERRHWIRMAHEFGYDAHAVYFDVPLEICSERNRRRQRVVPDDVMQRMSNKLRPPTFDEGFSKIIVVRVKQRTPDDAAQPAQDAEEPRPQAKPLAEPEPDMSAEPLPTGAADEPQISVNREPEMPGDEGPEEDAEE
jgi:predicted kinase